MDHGYLLTLSIHLAEIPTKPQNFVQTPGFLDAFLTFPFKRDFRTATDASIDQLISQSHSGGLLWFLFPQCGLS